MNTAKTEESPHLSEYYHILIKHKWTIITSLFLIITLTMLFSFLMKPVYQATTKLIIEKEESTSPITRERIDYESYSSQSLTFNTHFKLITSSAVIQKVIETLKLDETEKDIEVSPWRELISVLKENISLLMGKENKPITPEEKLFQLSKKLREKINIEHERDTRILNVSVDDHDPVMARDIADTLARSYVNYDIENRLSSTQNTVSWMTDQLYEMKKKLEDAEEEFLTYKQQEKLFSITARQDIITKKIQDFNDAYLKARNKRLELDTKLSELQRLLKKRGQILNVRSLIENPLIDNLYNQLLESEVELSRLSDVYKSKHPKITQLETKIDKTRKKLNGELEKEIENLRAERSVLLAKEGALQKTMADFENDALETSKKELKYSILERNVETNKRLYDTLLSRVKESNITGNPNVSNIRIAEKASASRYPIKPKKKLNFILSIIFGLMTGIGISFLWEYLDQSLRTEEDIQKYLDVPVLSIIPISDKAESTKEKSR
ncbi:MAG: GumC family protein [Thermodesulfobacteriota bacterium]